jgi:class 3 adenylate cyclase
MSKIALEHGATIDKYIGDAMLAFFGDPETRGAKADATACVDMAVAMQRRMQELQFEWRETGLGSAVPAAHRASARAIAPSAISAARTAWTIRSSAAT